ncbi:MAG: bacillithiol system redox-active protein YtxJ [bacterium]|nr:bacillithiol system redox-active protein YtxJ [bacterium]
MAIINKVDSIEKLDTLFERSNTEPVVLFKHSNSCGISAHVFETVQEIDSDLNVIVIQENRALSNEVAVRTGRSHQSPQAFVLWNGEPIYHATHYGIDPVAIERAISSHAVSETANG